MPNINQVYLDSLPENAPRSLAPDAAARELVEGHRAGYYDLPPAFVRAADGTEDLARRSAEASAALRNRYAAGWEGSLAGQLSAQVRSAAWSTGHVPEDVAGPLLAAQDEQRRLAAELSVLDQAARSSESAPETVARGEAPAIAAALERARAEVLEAAAEPASHIVGIDFGDPAALLAAPKPAQAAYAALVALLPRYHAVLTGREALAAIAPAHAPTWPPAAAGHPVAALASAAVDRG